MSLWSIASNVLGRSPMLLGLARRVLGRRDRLEHLWGEFDGEQCCLFCYQPKTLQLALKPCNANSFYRRTPCHER